MTNQEMWELATEIWDRIGEEPELAIAITGALSRACLASCHPEDRADIIAFFVGRAMPSGEAIN
jgi:hypothetical protein